MQQQVILAGNPFAALFTLVLRDPVLNRSVPHQVLMVVELARTFGALERFVLGHVPLHVLAKIVYGVKLLAARFAPMLSGSRVMNVVVLSQAATTPKCPPAGFTRERTVLVLTPGSVMFRCSSCFG